MKDDGRTWYDRIREAREARKAGQQMREGKPVMLRPRVRPLR